MSALYQRDSSGWTNLQAHWLREHQPTHRGRSWRSTIVEQRERTAQHLDETPSLRPMLADSIAAGYRYAMPRIDRETGLDATTFPATCPCAADQITDGGFLPGAA